MSLFWCLINSKCRDRCCEHLDHSGSDGPINNVPDEWDYSKSRFNPAFFLFSVNDSLLDEEIEINSVRNQISLTFSGEIFYPKISKLDMRAIIEHISKVVRWNLRKKKIEMKGWSSEGWWIDCVTGWLTRQSTSLFRHKKNRLKSTNEWRCSSCMVSRPPEPEQTKKKLKSVGTRKMTISWTMSVTIRFQFIESQSRLRRFTFFSCVAEIKCQSSLLYFASFELFRTANFLCLINHQVSTDTPPVTKWQRRFFSKVFALKVRAI